MLRIAICDDDTLQTDLMQEYFCDYNAVSPYKVEVTTFSSAEALLLNIEQSRKYDIYILDILMPGINGIELATKLRDFGDNGKIVFISADVSFVFKAFSVSASGYLVKPIKPEELFDIVSSLRVRIAKERPATILIKSDAGVKTIEVKDILYVDSIDRAPCYHLFDKSVVFGKSKRCRFQDMVADLLDNYPFVLSSVGMAVNLANIESIRKDTGEIIFRSGEVLFCSRTMKVNLIQRLEDYWNS